MKGLFQSCKPIVICIFEGQAQHISLITCSRMCVEWNWKCVAFHEIMHKCCCVQMKCCGIIFSRTTI
jgi:hypothetical protein